MKTTILLFFLFIMSLTAQEIDYSEDYERLIIKSDRIIEKISFRISTGNEYTENEPTNVFNVRNKIFVINLIKINKEADEIVIHYINEIVVLDF